MNLRICEFSPESTPQINAAEVHDSCRVYFWQHGEKLTNLHDTLSDICQSYSSAPTAIAKEKDDIETEREEVTPPQSAKRQKEVLSIKIMCAKLFGCKAKLLHTAERKPFLQSDEYGSLHISVAHTRGLYVLSVSSAPHGIDVEQKSNLALRLREKFLSDKERQVVPPVFLTPEMRATALWCAKEAAFKTFSSPTLTLLNQVSLLQNADGTVCAHPLGSAEKQALLHFFPLADSILAVCLPQTTDFF